MTAIFGPASASMYRVAFNLRSVAPTAHARFIGEMFEPLWAMGLAYGVDPVLMIAQSGHETGWGGYGGKVPPTYFNTAGIKVRDLTPFPDSEVTLAHSQYASFWAGAEAHAQHLCAYGGRALPEGRFLVDPRWVWVWGKHQIAAVEDLGGRWAPRTTYGNDLAALMGRLSA